MVLRDGFWWPDHEEISWRQMLEDVHDLDRAIRYVKGHKVCVQAGGNVGVWPLHLARTFESVVTLEPDQENYDCLSRNIDEVPNIYPIFGALGSYQGFTGLKRQIGNCGAHYVEDDGSIPVFTIDSLPLAFCDLIALDLEGMEPLVLAGAKKTIERFRPVIMVEDKWNSERYGVERGWSEKFPGYRIAERVGRHKDPILVPVDA